MNGLVVESSSRTYGGFLNLWSAQHMIWLLFVVSLTFVYDESRALQQPSAGGVSPSSGSRGSTDDRGGSSKTKARLVRRLSASSAMIAAAPVDAPSESYRSYIEQIPPEDGPQMFGMHASVRKRPVVRVRHTVIDSLSFCITYITSCRFYFFHGFPRSPPNCPDSVCSVGCPRPHPNAARRTKHNLYLSP